MCMEINKDFEIEFVGNIDDINSDNIDVYVSLSNGQQFTATFFTLANIKRILDRYKESGECAYGKYFWASDMIIVENINPLTIREAIADMIESEQLESAFMKIDDTEL